MKEETASFEWSVVMRLLNLVSSNDKLNNGISETLNPASNWPVLNARGRLGIMITAITAACEMLEDVGYYPQAISDLRNNAITTRGALRNLRDEEIPSVIMSALEASGAYNMEWYQDVITHLEDGNKIAAVKMVKDLGMGLLNAKRIVDAIEKSREDFDE
jgi:hypothetical protein